jgi:hypothetical protein
MGAGAIWDAVAINGLTHAAIKCWPYPESNPDYVLLWASLIFGLGYVDCAEVVRADLVSIARQGYSIEEL